MNKLNIWRKGASYIQQNEGRLSGCHLLRRNCLLNHVIEGKIEGTGRWEKRRKQLLDKVKEKKKTLKVER